MDKMKNYRQLLKELPSKTIVLVFGRFNPPTVGHELLIKVVKKVASNNNADYAIYVSRTQDKKKNPLSVERKIHYLNLMFPHTNFQPASSEAVNPILVAKVLNKKYKNLIMVCGSDRVEDYNKYLNSQNGKDYHYDSIQVISAGERDPDADDASGMSASKMRAVAIKGDYPAFKKGLPGSIRDIDGKLLMNEIRIGMGHDALKEQINLVKDTIREQYFKGEIFNIGDLVESNSVQYEIVKRGSNHLLLREESGALVSKWIQDVTVVKLGNSEMNEELTTKTIKPNDKLKVARIIASFLSVDNPEALSSPEQIVNMGLRKVRSKALNAESIAMLHKMLGLADEVGIQYDPKLIPQKLKESIDSRVTIDKKSNYNAAKDVMRYSDFKKLMKMNKGEIPEAKDVTLPPNNISSNPNLYPKYKKEKTNTPPDNMSSNPNDYNDKVAGDIDEPNNDTGETLPATSLAIKDLENQGPKDSEVGSSYGHGDDSQLRRRKVKYQREEVEIDEATTHYANWDKMSPEEKRTSVQSHSKAISDGNKKAQTIIDKLRDQINKQKNEDVMSSDFKIDPATGHKSRAHRIEFKNSGAKGKLDHKDEVSEAKKKIDKPKTGPINVRKDYPVVDDSDEISAKRGRGFDAFFEETEEAEEHAIDNITDTELDKIADSIDTVDDIIDAYTDDELAIIDDEGNEIEKDLKEEVLDEVLSRMERIRAKVRFARSKSARERGAKLALKRHSTTATINGRARKLAVKLLKQRIAKKPLDKLSIGEKERLEKMLAKRKTLINRLAMKLVSRVRKVETDRLANHKFTKK